MTQALAKERLIVFTRYPEPGKTKTRLIPLLGAEGAAKLQRRMTEHTLTQVKELQASYPVSVEVHFSGGTQQLMQDWLSCEFVYREQSQGDIGQRMASAFQTSFTAGMTRVVIIGIDCPDLKAQLMAKAFYAIAQHDLVLGPAEDGGYYLIGLRRMIPELFTGIRWSTAEVLPQTLT
ncbi:MAG: TIGR04282 family arsenosugar biosynthesis glycosyltransferase, partial [Coleofasciculus sp. S288]|nr:TIGR04282 family arsenosugar biosynthesis glycosyltransferase [Coleofasciculus sp. S288]